MITVPVAITALPEPPSTASPSDFDSKADAFLGAFPTLRTEINTISNTTYNNALEANAAALAVSASVNAAGVSAWDPATSYAQNAIVWSSTNYATYRKITTGSAITSDPITDSTNWVAITPITSFSTGTTGLTPTSAGTGTVTLGGTLVVANGGTGATTAANARVNLGAVGLNDTQTLTNKTLTGYTETVFNLTGTTPAINPQNGTIQTWTLTANSAPTLSLATGQSVTLLIDDGSNYAITWPSITWKSDSGFAPTLNLSGYTILTLWQVSAVTYGIRVGNI